MDIEVSPFIGFSAYSLIVCYPCSSPVMEVFVYHKVRDLVYTGLWISYLIIIYFM